MMPLKRLLLIVPLALWASLASAENKSELLDPRPWYRLEVILFAQSNLIDALESERWPEEYVQARPIAEEPARESARDVVVIRGLDVPAGREPVTAASPQGTAPGTDSSPLPEEFSWLMQDELQLDAAVSRLKRSSSMKLLWHGGWLQPGLEREAALPVNISLPREEPLLDEQGQALPYPPPPQLEGTLRLVLSRYLHIEADLAYLLPVDPQQVARSQADKGVIEEQPTAVYGDAGMDDEMAALAMATLSVEERDRLLRAAELGARPSWQVFHLRDSRRMRSGETHYLDHPLFGMVVQALPLEMSPADAAAAEEAEAQAAMDAQRLLEETGGDDIVTPATITAPR